MEDIKSKLDLLNYNDENNSRINKHAVSLIMSSSDDIQKIEELLLEKNVISLNKDNILVEPQNFKLFVYGYEYIKDMVDAYEEIDELDALKEDVGRVCSVGAINRLKKLKEAGIPYKDDEGKYLEDIFRLSLFNKSNRNVDDNKDDYSVGDILEKNQTMGLDSEAYFRYEELYDHAKNIIASLYGVDKVDSDIVDNMIKLITSGVEDDKVVLFYSITYGKELTDEEKHQISDAIYDELDYTNILNLNLGRAA